jgi:hypothetical protein
MNYIAQIKGFWLLHEKHGFSPTDISLYFYMLEVCNSANWVNPFKRNNAKVLADLKISRSTLERSRRRLNQCGILNFKSFKGTANMTYHLRDLALQISDRNKRTDLCHDAGVDAGNDATCDAGTDGLNKNNKPKPKQAVVVAHADAFSFFADTGNCRLLKDRFTLDDAAMSSFFKTFYDSKIDLGDLNNKALAETARNFYYWLPKHLAAGQFEKEKRCAKKESFHRAGMQPQRGVAVAMKFAGVKMREEMV